ncbi:hypothetical protein DF186_16435, partial [Enterococcus hirae]
DTAGIRQLAQQGTAEFLQQWRQYRGPGIAQLRQGVEQGYEAAVLGQQGANGITHGVGAR